MRKLYHRLKDVGSGVGEREEVCLGSLACINKADLEPIRARTCLISMENTPVKRKGRRFKCSVFNGLT